jgi:hypothetical protein
MRKRAVGNRQSAVETAAELEAMSRAQLADAFGPIAQALKPLEKRAALYKAEFERRGVTLLVGTAWSVQRSESSFDGVDVAAAKAELGAAWCEKHKKPVTRTSWKATPLSAADAAEAAA